MSWTQTARDEFLHQLTPLVDREAKYQAARYRIPGLTGDVANEVYLWLLKKMRAKELAPQDAPAFVTRQTSKDGYEVREAARNAARRLAGRGSRQAIELDETNEPMVPPDVTARLNSAMDEFSVALENCGALTQQDREALTNELQRQLGVDPKSARTTAQRKALSRAKTKVRAQTALLARFMPSLLLLLVLAA